MDWIQFSYSFLSQFSYSMLSCLFSSTFHRTSANPHQPPGCASHVEITDPSGGSNHPGSPPPSQHCSQLPDKHDDCWRADERCPAPTGLPGGCQPNVPVRSIWLGGGHHRRCTVTAVGISSGIGTECSGYVLGALIKRSTCCGAHRGVARCSHLPAALV